MNKELVKKQFSKSLKTYQTNAIVQKDMAKKLVSLIPKKNYDNLLELGCGTGFLTELACKKLNYSTYTAIDIVDDCQKYIKKFDDKIIFLNQDIETLELNKKYDLIISNAVFQWINDFEKFLERLKKHLTENGTIAFTTFGNYNFKEITYITGLSLNYLSIDELKSLLTPFQIDFLEGETIVQEFKTTTAMLKHMKKTGVNSINEKTWSIKELNDFKKSYEEKFDTVQLTYNPIYVICKIL